MKQDSHKLMPIYEITADALPTRVIKVRTTQKLSDAWQDDALASTPFDANFKWVAIGNIFYAKFEVSRHN